MQGTFLIAILLLGPLLIAVIVLAGKNGRKAAQVDALKAILKKQMQEQARANKIMDNVRTMPSDDVRKRLHDISSK